MRGDCTSCPIQALDCPPSASWDQAPGGPPKPGKQDHEVSDGNVQGGTEKGGHCIREKKRKFARRYDRGLPVEENLGQEPGIAQCDRTSRWDVAWK